jgi:hypothetical protein
MPDKKNVSTGRKLKDLRPKSVSSGTASKTKGGGTTAPRDSVSGNATGRRAYKP